MARQKKATVVTPAIQQQATASNGAVFVCSHLHKGVIFDMPDGRKVRISGINENLRGKEKGIISTGGGIFTKVNAEDWDFIRKTFADYAAIKNGLIYAESNPGRAKAAIRERSELRDGFEPIDPKATNTEAAKA